MSNDKHYPLHPNATRPPVMTCEIPLEEYESLKRENAQLKDEIKRLENVRKVHIEGIESMCEGLKLDAKQICRLKRALWLARADRAMMTLDYLTLKCRWFKDYMKVEPPGCDVKMVHKWANVERKCRAKAEEYK